MSIRRRTSLLAEGESDAGAALRTELDALKAAELNTFRARAAATPPKGQ